MIVGLALAGCAGAPAPAPSSTVTVTTTPSISSSAPATPSAPPSAAPSAATSAPSASASAAPVSRGGGDSGRPARQCADAALRVTLGQADGGAGNDYLPIFFTNTGSSPCELRGYPGVSVVGRGNGTQLGPAAERDGEKVLTGTLKPGEPAQAVLHLVNIERNGGPLGDRCTVVDGDGYRIYPPHSTRAVFIRHAGTTACSHADWMTIAPVTFGR